MPSVLPGTAEGGANAAGWARITSPAVDLFEWQAKELFGKYGVPVTRQVVVSTPAEARAAAEQLGGPVMVKAQVKAGGRGKAGGVKFAATPDDAEKHAQAILGM